MAFIEAIILGAVQGLTEFMPISSSAHLIIIPWLFGWGDLGSNSLAFDVALHLGTLTAVLWFFYADWLRLIRAGLASLRERTIGADPDRRLAWLLVVGCVPGAVVGALAESQIEQLFHQPDQPHQPAAMIAMALVVAAAGAALLLADRLARHQRGMSSLGLRDALIIGCAQALAVFPGVSRSGATITAGLALGLERPAAARFSFLLSAPIIAGAGLKSLWDVLKELRAGQMAAADLWLFAAGLLAAAIVGYLCIKYLLRYLQEHSTAVFTYYRWGLAALIVIVAIARG
ncbi:MAG: undecaprenyl-diphosphatase UppP [Anaerolineae bacterium]|nr:undecaprenyl-diphosphatase UppP [Anaerolineae bacterium]